ncbi:hypothetical protein TRFO_28689 [Tritrichomonas foetus]|uniref:UDENN domain-containing protein n=1 Tax=Tritrichomonas foetus TaxID=1144522 RepID=A0A1J4JZP2_9EUKA|nr:hypothetical protein TRFO_28689 [Tritrichomonas foetus]|eukprot:OHT03960.1 hypothetical protein TRFO_28689 [Tritrichomonas foetus]
MIYIIIKKNDNTSGFESDSLCRFGLVVSLLAAWSTNDEGNLIVNFPFSSFSFDLSEIKSWASTYSASILYPYVDQAWQALISNSGILIVSPDPRIASCAVSALLSLIEPLIYEDNVLFFTQRNDPRLAFLFKEQTNTTNIENENNSNLNENNSTGSDCFIPKRKLLDYDVVAVDDELVAEKIKQDFGLVIHINVLNNDNSVTVRDVYSNKTLRLFRVFMAIMNMKLLTDPYFDILQREMSAQEIEETFPNELPQELYEPFQKTKTFQKWRYRKVDREQLRQAFLSVSPKESVSKLKTVEDLLLAEKELNIILKKFSRDLHIETVIKSNLSLIKKKLKKLRK